MSSALIIVSRIPCPDIQSRIRVPISAEKQETEDECEESDCLGDTDNDEVVSRSLSSLSECIG